MGISAVIAGGSLGGLSAALALRCVNCDVNVFERSPGEMKSRGPGLVVQMELINFIKEHGIATEEAISVPAYKKTIHITRWKYTMGRADSSADDFMGQRLQTAKECFTE